MANRARPARDGIYPEGEIRFTYDGEPMDGYSVLSGGRATINGVATLRAADKSRRSLFIKVTGGGPMDIGPAGLLAGTSFTMYRGGQLTLDRAADARIEVATTVATTIEFLEERVAPDVPH